MQARRSPIARWTRLAATAESTPPDSPQIARRSGPTSVAIRCTSWSMKCPGVQSGVQPQIWNRKLWMISRPRGVCATSGWNRIPKIGFISCWNPATGALALEAVTRNPGGGCSILSPWLAHTVMHASGAKPANRPVASRTVTSARPAGGTATRRRGWGRGSSRSFPARRGGGGAAVVPRGRLEHLAPQQIVQRLALARHVVAVAFHQHLRRPGSLVVGRAHHEAIRSGAEHREDLARRDGGQLAIERQEVARLADRAHDVDQLLGLSAVLERDQIVMSVVVAGSHEVRHAGVHHHELLAAGVLAGQHARQQHARVRHDIAARLAYQGEPCLPDRPRDGCGGTPGPGRLLV